MFVFDAGVNLDEIVRAVNQVGAAPATWWRFSRRCSKPARCTRS